MAKTFKLEIITPETTVYDGEVLSLVLPAADGQLGVLADHAPLVTAVDIGEVKLEEADGTTRFMVVSDGFFEVAKNHARLLADAGERAEDIDVSRAQEAEKRARERLEEIEAAADKSASDTENPMLAFDRERAQRSLARALWRNRVGKKG